MVRKTFRIKSWYVKTYDEPEFNREEILRYARAKETSSETCALLDECLKEISGKLCYKVCFSEIPLKCVSADDDILDLTFTKVKSCDLKKNLSGADSIVIFAATIGLEIDRLINRYSRISPAKALFFQAIGTERIEALSNLFNSEVDERAKSEGKTTSPRFSPGSGDLPLDLQKDIFALLDCTKHIGLTLNNSLVMSPSKSVTAIIGIGDNLGEHNHNCQTCKKTDCVFRREL